LKLSIGVLTLEVLVNGEADSVEFTISGIEPTTQTRPSTPAVTSRLAPSL
jgi:hypothetical protein